MKEQIISKSNELVDLCINYHKKGMLGKMNIIDFFEQLDMGINENDYNKILICYCRILSKKGYEIKFNTNLFDIINYNSDEYIDYWEKIINNT